MYFNSNSVKLCQSQKYLDVTFDKQLNFSELLFRSSLLTKYKSSICPHLDYGDILYDNSRNGNPKSTLGKVKY